MNYEDVQKVSNAAKAKSNLVNTNFFKYFIRAVMAGFFIDVAMIYSNVVGNVFSKTMPEWGKFMGALVFSIAVLLISFVGGELFTGNNMVMAFGAYDKHFIPQSTPRQTKKLQSTALKNICPSGTLSLFPINPAK